MRKKSTLVALFFVISGLLLAWVLHLAVASIFGVAGINNKTLLQDQLPISLLIGVVGAAAIALGAYSNAKVKGRSGEVIDELNKVNWPSAQETKMNTGVVVVTSVIAAAILGVFDITFGWLSDWLAHTTF